jgi:hypothetical protein
MGRINQIRTSRKPVWMLWCVWAQAAFRFARRRVTARRTRSVSCWCLRAAGRPRSRIPAASVPGDTPASSRRSPLPASPLGSDRAQRLVHLGAAVLIRQPRMVEIGFKSVTSGWRRDQPRIFGPSRRALSAIRPPFRLNPAPRIQRICRLQRMSSHSYFALRLKVVGSDQNQILIR